MSIFEGVSVDFNKKKALNRLLFQILLKVPRNFVDTSSISNASEMFPSAGPGGRPQLLRVLRAEPGRPGGRRGRGRLHGHGGLEGLGPGAVNSNNDLIILYASINCVCLKLVMWLCYDEVKPFSLYNSFFHL